MIISSVARKRPAYLTLIAPKEGEYFGIKNLGSNERWFNFDGDFNQRGIKDALIEPPLLNLTFQSARR